MGCSATPRREKKRVPKNIITQKINRSPLYPYWIDADLQVGADNYGWMCVGSLSKNIITPKILPQSTSDSYWIRCGLAGLTQKKENLPSPVTTHWLKAAMMGHTNPAEGGGLAEARHPKVLNQTSVQRQLQ